MATLTIPITTSQIAELVRQLPAEDRCKLIDELLSERFEAVLAASDAKRAPEREWSDADIQSEIDVVRQTRYEDRVRANRR